MSANGLIAAFNAPFPSTGIRRARWTPPTPSCPSFPSASSSALDFACGSELPPGLVAAGTVGRAERQTYTLYGDTVNLAQRLEELNKELDKDCLICGTTFKTTGSSCVDAVAMGLVQVRGREGAIEVFALKR
jgi:adenylate cyclase